MKAKKCGRTYLAICGILVMFVVMLATGFTFAQEKQQDYIKVRYGVIPYFDYTAWPIATELGWDHELGLDIELVKILDDPKASAALSRGDIDASGGCIGVIVAVFPRTPEVRFFNNGVQFKGFAIEIREGEYKTYKDFRAEGLSEEEAIRAAVSQMKGKTLITQIPTYDTAIAQTLEQAGLTLDDIERIDMEQALGAVAFIRGTADFYQGGFPQHLKLRKAGGYVPLVEADQMGLASLWFSNNETTERYYKEHKDVIIKLNAIWYRMVRLMHEHPEAALPLMGKLLNDITASDFDYDYLKLMFDNFVYFAPMKVVEEEFLNPGSRTYYARFVDYMIKYREKEGDIPKGTVRVKDMSITEEVHMYMTGDTELMDWLNKPFTKEETRDRRYLLEK